MQREVAAIDRAGIELLARLLGYKRLKLRHHARKELGDVFFGATEISDGVTAGAVGVVFDGEEVVDEDGYELNFASPEILDMTDTSRPIPEAVRAFFGVDPHLEAAALAILDAAGYSDTVDTTDPTMESTTN